MAKHLELGVSGELMAERFLVSKGLVIVGRRVWYKRGEIDLVARQGEEWVFVEVKTRKGDACGSAAEAFTPEKARRMRRAVEMYVYENSLANAVIRCDFVGIDIAPDGAPEITWFPGGITWEG